VFSIGFIDYFLDEWHANNYPEWIRAKSGGTMSVTHAYAMIDSPKGGRGTEGWCREMGVQRCRTIDEVIRSCDGLVVLSPDNVEMHEQLCGQPLRSGKPVYVDKVFAPDLAAAKRFFKLADESGTPCYSASALRYAREYRSVPRAGIQAISSWGPGDIDSYSVHQLEPVVMLMGVPAERVLALPGRNGVSLSIVFVDGRWATVSCFAGESPFAMNLCMEPQNAAIHVESAFFEEFTAALVAFFIDGKPSVPHEETLWIMALREAGMRALANPCEWISAPR